MSEIIIFLFGFYPKVVLYVIILRVCQVNLLVFFPGFFDDSCKPNNVVPSGGAQSFNTAPPGLPQAKLHIYWWGSLRPDRERHFNRVGHGLTLRNYFTPRGRGSRWSVVVCSSSCVEYVYGYFPFYTKFSGRSFVCTTT